MTPLPTPIFDFHKVIRALTTLHSDSVASEKQPLVGREKKSLFAVTRVVTIIPSRCRYGKVQRQLAIGKSLLEGGGTFDQVKMTLF